ncbi:hypothetical protein NM688_g156 [Phlebia brevispora]|uniref:Uncharacterized protein n=1 Tax=Phlebia brevispora TaxID=194682 RepID=A0ACC1TF41_9APHY|nr:hypothetical protein NM688_g156 [Phlebia brevispora]
MKFLSLFSLVSTAILPTVMAAPPGVQWWETIGGVAVCGEGDLLSVGFAGQTGTGCLSLADDATTDNWLVYYLWSNCSLNAYAGAGCSPSDTVLSVPNPPAGTDVSACLEVSGGFRSLEVTCT